jgi:rubrerythrin
MTEPNVKTGAGLVAELNDLLQSDHDAVQAYAIAIEQLGEPEYRRTLERFREDHERHIRELTELIRAHGGIPLELPHVPTGMFKAAVQRAGALGGDWATLLAFKANERQVRDRYREAACQGHPEDVADMLGRAAADEARHYVWALEMLDHLNLGPDSMVGRVEGALERGHQHAAELIEKVERRMLQTVEQVRTGDLAGLGANLHEQVKKRPLSAALILAGIGFLIGRAARKGSARKG